MLAKLSKTIFFKGCDKYPSTIAASLSRLKSCPAEPNPKFNQLGTRLEHDEKICDNPKTDQNPKYFYLKQNKTEPQCKKLAST